MNKENTSQIVGEEGEVIISDYSWIVHEQLIVYTLYIVLRHPLQAPSSSCYTRFQPPQPRFKRTLIHR